MRVDRHTTSESVVAATSAERPDTGMYSLEGTIQRVNYQTRELSVIADGRAWRFVLSPDCQLWFDGRRAPLRCFQPLDHIRIFGESLQSGRVAEALYVWAEEREGSGLT